MTGAQTAFPAALRHPDAAAWLAQTQAQLARCGPGERFVVDAAPLADFDSSALAVLLDLQRAAGLRGVDLRLAGISAQLQQLADVYGVAGLLPESA